MSTYNDYLMGKPSVEGDTCPFCGRKATNRHHIVRRSQGGTDGPTVPVCGSGNLNGCHGLFHSERLHMRWNDGWEWLYTSEPTKELGALLMEGWQRLDKRRSWDEEG